jgi:hypothetical protein
MAIGGHQQHIYTSRTERFGLHPRQRTHQRRKPHHPKWIRAFNKIARDAGTSQCRHLVMLSRGAGAAAVTSGRNVRQVVTAI